VVPTTPPPGATAGSTDWDVVPVFFGTDRNRRDLAKRIGYGTDRGHRLEVGRALVTVPKAHQVPNVERPWAIRIPYTSVVLYQQDEDPKKHFTIQEIKALSKEDLLALIRDRLKASKSFRDQALVFIHGYNNLFDDALFRTAQIAYDLKYDGAPFLYSWPSGAGIAGYPYDSNSAQQAEQYFSQFLLMVLKETGAKNVSIIAHSMGNQLLLQALRNLDRTHPEVARINQIILAAPDVDRDSFQFLAAQIRDVGKGITMYASSNDVALGISRRFAGGVPRAGDVPVGLGPIVVSGVDTIDVSALSTEYLSLNHSSYAEKTGLLKDIELVLRTGVRPPEIRLPLLERIKGTGGQGDYWRYPK
jgi:esterase/lipase superfamily enzyme